MGGNMAAAVTLLAGEKTPWPQDQLPSALLSRHRCQFQYALLSGFCRGPVADKSCHGMVLECLCSQSLRSKKTHCLSPPFCTPNQLHNLPPALIITDENDVLRDEGEAYAHKLIQAGVEVTTMRCLGTCHHFLMLNPLSKTPATRSVITLAIDHLQKVFMQKKKAKQTKVA